MTNKEEKRKHRSSTRNVLTFLVNIFLLNGKTTTLSFFLDGLFPKTEISYMRDDSSGDKIIRS
jgi:hypothetical protein